MGVIVMVDPAKLRLPGGRMDGADPYKLIRQTAKHGDRIDDMPPPEVRECADGELQINDGVTRATRAAKLRPGELIPVEIKAKSKVIGAKFPTVGERL